MRREALGWTFGFVATAIIIVVAVLWMVHKLDSAIANPGTPAQSSVR